VYDAAIAELARGQHNRVARRQLLEMGIGDGPIARRVASGRLFVAEEGVFAVAPVLEEDDWGGWMGATLTAPNTFLSRTSAAAAWGVWTLPRRFETVTRPGNGGPRRHGGVVAYRSLTLEGETTTHRGVPITTVPRTLLDLAASRVSQRSLARAVREAVRLEFVTIPVLAEALRGWRRRRGARRLTRTIARYSGLPIERARSGAEVRAMEILRDAGRPLPRLNHRIAGEEADLSWLDTRLIIEIDGGPFHLDVGEDARKQACWEQARWTVLRLPAEEVYRRPNRLLSLAPR
jgi:Protein of unknown function (DUF559)